MDAASGAGAGAGAGAGGRGGAGGGTRGADFTDLVVTARHLVTAAPANTTSDDIVNEDEEDVVVELADLDRVFLVHYSALSWVIVYEGGAVDEEKLLQAVRAWVAANPIVAGRFEDEAGRSVRVSSAKGAAASGLPVSLQRWPSGTAADVPAATTIRGAATQNPPHCPLIDAIDVESMVKGEDSLVKLCLTHLGDGSSVLGFCVSHAIADIARMHTMLYHLSDAFHGRPLPVGAYADRSLMSTSRVLDYVGQEASEAAMRVVGQLTAALQAAVEELREIVDINENPDILHIEPAPGMPKSTGFGVECLHVSSQALRDIKAKLAPHVARCGEDAVSTNDILTALHWMIKSHMYGWPLPGTPGDTGSFTLIPLDLLRNGAPDLVPRHFVGNAFATINAGPAPHYTHPHNDEPNHDTNNDSDDNHLLAVLANAACVLRREVLAFRKEWRVRVGIAVASSSAFYQRESYVVMPKVLKLPPCRGVVSNWTGYSLEKMNLGVGPASCMMSVCTWLARGFACVVPAMRGDGVYLQMNVEEPYFGRRVREEGFVERMMPGIKWC